MVKTPADVSEGFDAEFNEDTLELHLSPADLLALSQSAEQILARRPTRKAAQPALAAVATHRPASVFRSARSPVITRSHAPALTRVPPRSAVTTAVSSRPTSNSLSAPRPTPNTSEAPSTLTAVSAAPESAREPRAAGAQDTLTVVSATPRELPSNVMLAPGAAAPQVAPALSVAAPDVPPLSLASNASPTSAQFATALPASPEVASPAVDAQLTSILPAAVSATAPEPARPTRKPDAQPRSAGWPAARIAGIVGIATLALALAIFTFRWSQSDPDAASAQDTEAGTPVPTASEERTSEGRTSDARTAAAGEPSESGPPLVAEQHSAPTADSTTTPALRETSSPAPASTSTQTGAAGPAQAPTSPLAQAVTASTPSHTAEPPPASPQGRTVRIRNPFDRAEIFQFPAGTSKAEAREQMEELLLQRALERQAKRQLKKPAARGHR